VGAIQEFGVPSLSREFSNKHAGGFLGGPLQEISSMNNPKLEGSNIIDCIPQTGPCPGGCIGCFYTKDEPLIPTVEEVGDKIVRTNSGHDSNRQKKLVLDVTAEYPRKFYNTSLMNFDFPGPVVFTANAADTDHSVVLERRELCKNLMAVRIRTNTWNLALIEAACHHYPRLGVPVIITFMRYKSLIYVPPPAVPSYKQDRHILNTWYSLYPSLKRAIYEKSRQSVPSKYRDLVRVCGAIDSSYCRDCGNCEEFYWRAMDRGGQ